MHHDESNDLITCKYTQGSIKSRMASVQLSQGFSDFAPPSLCIIYCITLKSIHVTQVSQISYRLWPASGTLCLQITYCFNFKESLRRGWIYVLECAYMGWVGGWVGIRVEGDTGTDSSRWSSIPLPSLPSSSSIFHHRVERNKRTANYICSCLPSLYQFFLSLSFSRFFIYHLFFSRFRSWVLKYSFSPVINFSDLSYSVILSFFFFFIPALLCFLVQILGHCLLLLNFPF